GWAEFEVPVGHFAVGVLHVHINPGVGVHPLDLGDRALHLEGPVDVELGSEGVMRSERRRGTNNPDKRFQHSFHLPCSGGFPNIFTSVWLPSAQANSSDSTPAGTLVK